MKSIIALLLSTLVVASCSDVVIGSVPKEGRLIKDEPYTEGVTIEVIKSESESEASDAESSEASELETEVQTQPQAEVQTQSEAQPQVFVDNDFSKKVPLVDSFMAFDFVDADVKTSYFVDFETGAEVESSYFSDPEFGTEVQTVLVSF